MAFNMLMISLVIVLPIFYGTLTVIRVLFEQIIFRKRFGLFPGIQRLKFYYTILI